MTSRPLVLFDVDGTLLLTGGVAFGTMKRVARELFGEGFSWEGITVSGHLDPLIYAEAAARNSLADAAARHDAFRDRYLAELAGELARSAATVRALPGVHETLASLETARHAVLGLLTGNYSAAVPIKLSAVGIDPARFEITAFGDEGETRAELVRVALEKYRRRFGEACPGHRTVIVGDTPRDVACAHANGCLAFAVATGAYGEEDLRAAGADLVVPDLRDPTPLLDLVARL